MREPNPVSPAGQVLRYLRSRLPDPATRAEIGAWLRTRNRHQTGDQTDRILEQLVADGCVTTSMRTGHPGRPARLYLARPLEPAVKVIDLENL